MHIMWPIKLLTSNFFTIVLVFISIKSRTKIIFLCVTETKVALRTLFSGVYLIFQSHIYTCHNVEASVHTLGKKNIEAKSSVKDVLNVPGTSTMLHYCQ